MARVIFLIFVILFSVYLTEQTSFLSQDYIDEINNVATTWKVSNCNILTDCNYTKSTHEPSLCRYKIIFSLLSGKTWYTFLSFINT